MANNDVSVSCLLPVKTAKMVEHIASTFGYSRGKTLHLLIEQGILAIGEDVENSSVSQNGVLKKDSSPRGVSIDLRELL